MGRKTTKCFVRKSLSLGQETINRAIEVIGKYQALLREKERRSISDSEVYELAINTGFTVLENAFITVQKSKTQLNVAIKEAVEKEIEKSKPKTIADLTDEELTKLEDE